MKKQNEASQGELRLFVERKPIEEFPDYEVTSDGRVWSKEREVSNGRGGFRRAGGKWLKGSMNGRGYLTVSLHNDVARKTVHIHSLVAGAFIGPRPDGMDVDHVDRDKANNHLSNLRYVTKRANQLNNAGKGVSFDKHSGKWRAQVSTNGKLRYLGLFDSEADALKVRRAAHAEQLEEALMESRLRARVAP